MEAVAVGGLKRARGGAYNGPEAAAAAVTLKKLRLDAATAAAAAAAAAMNMPPTGHTSPLGQQQQQQQAAQGAANAAAVDGQVVQVTGMCNSIDSVGPGEEEVSGVKTETFKNPAYYCLSVVLYLPGGKTFTRENAQTDCLCGRPVLSGKMERSSHALGSDRNLTKRAATLYPH